ncbi:hypothetical protein [Pseudanabaena sp. FACHB-2040]|uniref:hypothetical protein n=1 Tax=Pseudanabaena sp. FACHB-2040 TaxID=2692859 RepID=UPI0016834CD0|nr:hypothetical protein [Pseudanabaena sp. FACHB-2040]MBD2259442.1 hypothetical protein [Pseudanabaena sp. FACHB-2040]
MNISTRLLSLSGILIIASGLVACADLQMRPQPEPLPPEPVPPGAVSPGPNGMHSWSAMLGPTSVPAGWQVIPCDNPTLLCVYVDGDIVGTVELFTETVAGSSFGAKLAEAGGDQDVALKAWATDFYASMEQDRTMGAPTLKFSSQAPEVAPVGSLSGIRYSFSTSHDNGTLADYSLGYAATDGTTLYVIATGLIVGDPTGSFSDYEAMQQFEPHLAEIIAGLNL